MTYTNLGKK